MEEIIVTESMSDSQRKRIIQYMEEHGSITSWEAMHELNIMSPRKRLSEINRKYPLKKEVEYHITHDVVGHKKTTRYIRYSFYE